MAKPEVSLSLRAPLQRAELAGLLEQASALLERGGVRLLRCDVTGVVADPLAVDVLARLALAARRRGSSLCISGASEQLLELIELSGLSELLADPGAGRA